jgi:uncharacterized protein (DUF952 family)
MRRPKEAIETLYRTPTTLRRPKRGRRLGRTMADDLIFHMCRRDEWQAALARGAYAGSSQDQADGFIHFSTATQIVESAARHRAGQEGLVLLAVDPAALGPTLRWEPSRGGQLFPHLHGDLAPSAVRWVHDLPLGPDGVHRFPNLG